MSMNRFTVFFLVFFITSLYGYTQPLISTPGDAFKLKNDSSFRDKPLGTLLKEIGPEIKTVFAEGRRDDGYPGYLVFHFISWQDVFRQRCNGKRPLRITVFLKEYFDWNKPKGEVLKWTAADAERLGNLTIAFIRISGEPEAETYAL